LLISKEALEIIEHQQNNLQVPGGINPHVVLPDELLSAMLEHAPHPLGKRYIANRRRR